MGRLLVLILSLFFITILINFTLGDVKELLRETRQIREEPSDKFIADYENDEKAMDDLYSSLNGEYSSNKRPYNFDKPEFEKHLVDALNRIKYVGNDFNNKNVRQKVPSDSDIMNVNSNVNSMRDSDEEKNTEENLESDEFYKIDKNQLVDNKELIDSKNNDNGYYKRNDFDSLNRQRNGIFYDKNNNLNMNYNNIDNGENENDFVVKNNYNFKESSVGIDNQENEEDKLNNINGNNVLHASLKKVDKHCYKNEPFEDTSEVIKFKRNSLENVDEIANDNYRNNDNLDVSNDNIKVSDDQTIHSNKPARKIKKKKRSEKHIKTDKTCKKNNKNDGNEKENRNKRKRDDLKILNNSLNTEGANDRNVIDNSPDNALVRNVADKLGKLEDVRIHAVESKTNVNVKDGLPSLSGRYNNNITKLITRSTGFVPSTPSANVGKSKVSMKSHSPSIQFVAVARCPFRGRSTTQSSASKKNKLKENGSSKENSVVVAPALHFNLSSDDADDIRVAHQINDFVAAVLFNAGRTGTMRKELGLCKTYDKKYPFHVNKALDEKLMNGLMDCIGNILKSSMDNQKCTEMPAELKVFVDWLLLNGISAREEFKQFMALDGSQRKMFLFSNDGVCGDKSGPQPSPGKTTPGHGIITVAPSDNAKKTKLSSSKPAPSTPKPRKFIGALRKLYFDSPVNIFGGTNRVEKSMNKNPYSFFKHYFADKSSSMDNGDQQLYRNLPLYNPVRYNEDGNDWRRKSKLFVEGSDRVNDDKYVNDVSLIDSPNRADLARYYYNSKPEINKKLKRDNVLDFETPEVYGEDDDRETFAIE